MLFKSFEGRLVTMLFKTPLPPLGVYSAGMVKVDGKELLQFLMASPEQCLEPPAPPQDYHVLYNALFMYEVAKEDEEERALWLAETPMLCVTYRPWLTRAMMHEGKPTTFTGPMCSLLVREESVDSVLAVADGPTDDEMRLLVGMREEAMSAAGRPKIIV